MEFHWLTVLGLWSNSAQWHVSTQALALITWQKDVPWWVVWCPSQCSDGKLMSCWYFEGENFVVDNGGYEEHVLGENKSMSYDAVNILMPDFRSSPGTILPKLTLWEHSALKQALLG